MLSIGSGALSLFIICFDLKAGALLKGVFTVAEDLSFGKEIR